MNKEELQRRRRMINPNYISHESMGNNSISTSRISKNDIENRRREIDSGNKQLFNSIEKHQKEEARTINIIHNADKILSNLDQIFEERTSLNKLDWSILMLATALQLCRIYLLPKFQEKFADEDRIEHDDEEMKKMVGEEKSNYADKHDSWENRESKKGYRSWRQIVWEKVPYDATQGSSAEGINMRGGSGHRLKSLGHDPVLGWIFGVCNIISDTITITPEYSTGEKKFRIPAVRTHRVQMKGQFIWKEQIPTYKIFTNSYESICEDKHRLYAAIFAQGVHLTSDMYSKCGLPIPFLSLIDSDTAYKIYKKGYDYLDLKFDTQILSRAFKSAALSIMINNIIGGIHTLFYNPDKDPKQELYSVKTRKILLYSNLIATSSDVIQTAIRSYAGDENAIKNFDFGGFIVTIYRLTTDIAFIQKIKEEFIFSEWEKIMDNSINILNI